MRLPELRVLRTEPSDDVREGEAQGAGDGRGLGDGRGNTQGLAVQNPWTLATLATVHETTAAEADAAVATAVAAFAKTRLASRHERATLLEAIAAAISADQEALAELLSAEAGKPIVAARTEVSRAITTFRLGAEVARTLVGEQIPLDVTATTENVDGYALRVPRGPILAISPFNFPLNLVAHKVAPALAVGAPVVLKPAPQTPLIALRLAEIVHACAPNTPWLQVLPCAVPVAAQGRGANSVPEQLVADPRFAYVTFTGSDAVGFRIKANSGKKPVCLELGGNAAAIVHADAPDLEAAARALVASAFGYAGQVCIKTQRIFVHASIYKRFVDAFVEEARGWHVGDPSDPETKLGPVIDARAGIRIAAIVDEALQFGAKSLLPRQTTFPSPNRIEPVALELASDPLRRAETNALRVVTEEVFGPVVTIQSFVEDHEAIARVNASRYGLQAAIFTDSNRRIHEAVRDLQVGGVVVNDTPSLRLDGMPYGGVKDSGLGREGVRAAALDMTETKMVVYRR